MSAIDEVLNRNPLVPFSVYTQIQCQCLFDIGNEIIVLMDGNTQSNINWKNFNKAYGLIWLWILGAFEVLRVMYDAKECFDDQLKPELKRVKTRFAKIRAPLAKQQKPGTRENVGTIPSIGNFNDGDMGFKIDGEVYFFKSLFNDFKNFIEQIKPSHIKKSLDDFLKK